MECKGYLWFRSIMGSHVEGGTSMRKMVEYLDWFAGICSLLGVFTAVLLVSGLREATIGRVATTVVLLMLAVVLWVVSCRRRRSSSL